MKRLAFCYCIVVGVFLFQPNDIYAKSSTKKINLNSADAGAIAHIIHGIGDKRALAIIQYRETHGPYRSLEELSNVTGLSKKFVKKNIEKLEEIFVLD